MSLAFPAFFTRSVCCLLTLTALLKLYSATGTTKLLNHSDPFFVLTNRSLMIGVGLIELGIAAYVLLGRNRRVKCSAILWLSSNFLFYRLGNYLAGNQECPCLGTVFDRLGLNADVVNFALSAIVLYLFCGSLWCLRQHLRGVNIASLFSFGEKAHGPVVLPEPGS